MIMLFVLAVVFPILATSVKLGLFPRPPPRPAPAFGLVQLLPVGLSLTLWKINAYCWCQLLASP